MRKNNFTLICLFLCFLSCSPSHDKAESIPEIKSETKNIYSSIQQVADALPMTQEESFNFFSNLDSIKLKTFRNSQSQQFQYPEFTVFYELPRRGKQLNGVGIDLDTNSHVNMEELGKQLNATWHSAELIEVKEAKIHYTADYLDAKKQKKKIHITIGLSYHENEAENEITFIGIDTDWD
jgi:hypothetical protein